MGECCPLTVFEHGQGQWLKKSSTGATRNPLTIQNSHPTKTPHKATRQDIAPSFTLALSTEQLKLFLKPSDGVRRVDSKDGKLVWLLMGDIVRTLNKSQLLSLWAKYGIDYIDMDEGTGRCIKLSANTAAVFYKFLDSTIQNLRMRCKPIPPLAVSELRALHLPETSICLAPTWPEGSRKMTILRGQFYSIHKFSRKLSWGIKSVLVNFTDQKRSFEGGRGREFTFLVFSFRMKNTRKFRLLQWHFDSFQSPVQTEA